MCFGGQTPTLFVRFSFSGLPINICWALMPMKNMDNWIYCKDAGSIQIFINSCFPSNFTGFLHDWEIIWMENNYCTDRPSDSFFNQGFQRSINFECRHFAPNISNHYAKLCQISEINWYSCMKIVSCWFCYCFNILARVFWIISKHSFR